MAPIVKNFKSVRRAGVFSEHSHSAVVPDFHRFNLVYGFNGCGKTTLSRILRSIEQGTKSPKLPEDCQFSICFTEGPDLTQASCTGTRHPTIVVFNEDFIEENLRWRDGQASPVYFVGEEQARLSELVDRLAGRIDGRRHAQQSAEDKLARITDELTEFKRDLARLIASELNLGRRYVATQLEQDYRSINLAGVRPLSEDEIKAKKELINRTSAASKVEPISGLPISLPGYFERVRSACAESFAAAALDELKQHATMLKWVKDGLDYHTSHSLETCLFCGNNFTAERAGALQASIDARFEKTVASVQALHDARAKHFDEIDQFQQRLPAISALDASLGSEYGKVREQLINCASTLHAALTEMRAPLDAKLRMPNIAVDASKLDVETARQQTTRLQELAKQATALIQTHNDKVDRFEEEKAEAARALKIHHLLEGKARFDELTSNFDDAERELKIRTRLFTKLETLVGRARQQLRAHGLAIEPINKLLASYLGHAELSLATVEEGYQIHRNGAPITGPLSEGEKTALAICYFLSKLEEDGRKKKDIIAIIDDPISSLDSKALNYAFNLLRLALEGAAQVIMLTHNLQFMNETKKWLKPKLADASRPDKLPTAALFFLDTTPVSPTARRAAIKALPKLLRDYDSEYHYLFSLVLKFVEAEADSPYLGYTLPNALRKILELFLHFKHPGPDGLGSKLRHPTVQDCGLDQARINALLRLADLESHGDNLDDVISFSSMTIEEIRDAAGALFALMEKLDAHHFARMKSLCQ